MASSLHSIEYLETLPPILLTKLYRQPSTALAIFRLMLPQLAKTIVMGMLFLQSPLPALELDAWVKPDLESSREKENSLSLLARLQMIEATSKGGRPHTWNLKQPFRTSMRNALTGGGNHQSFGVPCDTPDKHPISVQFLDEHAKTQWEAILHYIVGSAGAGNQQSVKEPSDSVKQLLAVGRLIEMHHRRVEITQTGFAFLLEQLNAQVWNLLITYIDTSGDRGLDPEETLAFAFLLGSLELGQDYSVENLTNSQLQMLNDLDDLGMTYRRKSSSRRFYPTRLAAALGTESGTLQSGRTSIGRALSGSNDAGQGFIVIETNYRLYAYTSSPLQIAVLQLFANIKSRFPNMVMGKITRESIRRAVATGITSEQIISYLSTHAHPQMRGSSTTLPPTVMDQISLWQMESERMTATPGYLFKDFANADEYEIPCKYAEEIGVLVWKNDAKRLFFVTKLDMVANLLKKRGSERAERR